MQLLQILVLLVLSLCIQISHVHSLIECLLECLHRYLSQEAGGNMYMCVYDNIYASKLKTEYIIPGFGKNIPWQSSCNKRAVLFLSDSAHTFILRYIYIKKSHIAKEKPAQGSKTVSWCHLFWCWINVVI